MLLIGCVNLAGLQLARGVGRAPEIATRIAVGGGRAAIVWQLLAVVAIMIPSIRIARLNPITALRSS